MSLQSRWSTLLIDDASIKQLGVIPTDHYLNHADLLAARRLRPRDLYRRWEEQQWNALEIDLSQDAVDFAKRLPRRAKRELSWHIASFIIGEYTGLDLLSPILTGSHSEEDSLFLATQLADEARHSRMMFRVGEEVLGLNPDPEIMLRQSWDLMITEQQEMAVEETALVQAVVAAPTDYVAWLRAVTYFHMINEGMLALVGQRVIVGDLGRMGLMPGIRAAFAGMCRDESRHVGFGLYALRIGMHEGHAEAIYDVLESVVPRAAALTDGPDGSTSPQPARDLFEQALRRATGAIGADTTFTEHLVDQVRTARSLSPEQVASDPQHVQPPHPRERVPA
ncbi:MAG: ribonucleotide-diphosphate reductase subunit beta [Terracoccus sp.]